MKVNLSTNSFSEEIATNLLKRINNPAIEVDDINYIKMKYGLEVLTISFTKTCFILIAALLLGLFKGTLIIMLSFAFIRQYAFGVHAKSSMCCTIITSACFFLGSSIPNFIKTNNYMVLIMFSVSLFLLFLYAPADTEARPLIEKNFRMKLKRRALISTTILLILALLLSNNCFKFGITYGVLCESLTITPLVYKLLNRRYKNYEHY